MGDRKTKWQVFKYPRYAGNALIGVGGLAIQEITPNQEEDGEVS